MDAKYALDWMTKLALERVAAHENMPATQEAVLERLKLAAETLRVAITPKDAGSDGDPA